MIILWLLFLIVVLWIIQFRYKRRRIYELASTFPSASGPIPLLGVAHRFIGNTESIMSSLRKISYECITQGGTIKGWFGPMLYFMVADPVNTETVLKSCLEKDDILRFVANVLGYGIILAPVPIWKVRRKVMMPALTPKIVDSFFHIFVTQANELAENLEPFCGTGQFETALGVKIKSQNDPNVPFLTALNKVLKLVSERIFQIWLQPDWLYKLFRSKYTEHEKCRRIIMDFLDEIILNKRKDIDANKTFEIKNDGNILENYKNQAFLDLLIYASGGDKGYNDVELREEVLILIIAGADTSAASISNTLLLMGKYPNIQEKVHEELLSVFENSDRPLVKEDLPKLQYLERVIKESLRLFPPGPVIVRKTVRETALPSGHILPAGSGVIISIFGAHRDPKYWGPDVECFDPDRFLPERYNLPYPCCYIPFSNGPRNCVGYQYAMMSMKGALSTILRRYKVIGTPEKGPIPHIKMKYDLTMKAVDDYQIELLQRK
ncbi:cytochrome P450 4C1-like isoform X2 [Epargyreus clarus]|uniref:cytochrome P450 4C1-like isoform X2 n=1 Tax=Epargyreus clarus TaxID=520877 RepID=UPI003C30BFEF